MKILDFRSLNAFFSIDGPDLIYVNENNFKNTSIHIPINLGVPHTEETKRKISEANKGKTSYWKGKNIPQDVINKMKQTLKGTRVGENNSRAKTYNITFEDGTSVTIKSLETWARENGYKPTSLRNLYNGRTKSKHKNIISVTPVELSTTS
jgi:hypothetical protein